MVAKRCWLNRCVIRAVFFLPGLNIYIYIIIIHIYIYIINIIINNSVIIINYYHY